MQEVVSHLHRNSRAEGRVTVGALSSSTRNNSGRYNENVTNKYIKKTITMHEGSALYAMNRILNRETYLLTGVMCQRKMIEYW